MFKNKELNKVGGLLLIKPSLSSVNLLQLMQMEVLVSVSIVGKF